MREIRRSFDFQKRGLFSEIEEEELYLLCSGNCFIRDGFDGVWKRGSSLCGYLSEEGGGDHTLYL